MSRGCTRLARRPCACRWVGDGSSCWVVPRSRPATPPCGEVQLERPAACEERAGEDVRAARRRTAAAWRVEDDHVAFWLGGWVVTFPGVLRLSEWVSQAPIQPRGVGPVIAVVGGDRVDVVTQPGAQPDQSNPGAAAAPAAAAPAAARSTPPAARPRAAAGPMPYLIVIDPAISLSRTSEGPPASASATLRRTRPRSSS